MQSNHVEICLSWLEAEVLSGLMTAAYDEYGNKENDLMADWIADRLNSIILALQKGIERANG